MMQEVEVLKTIPELVCSYFSEEQFTLSQHNHKLQIWQKYCMIEPYVILLNTLKEINKICIHG